MPSQKISASPAGLYVQPNNLSQVPDGALEQADDVVISRDGIVEPRRGQATLTSVVGTGIADLFGGLDGVWAYGVAGTDVLSYYPSTTRIPAVQTGVTALVASVFPSGVRAPYGSGQYFRAVSFGGYLYGAGGYGVLRSDKATITRAGMPPGLDMAFTLSAAGTPTALATGFQVAYRAIWVRAQGSGYIRGAPSTRLVVANAAGATRDVTLTLTVPQGGGTYGWGVQAGDVFQVYRSPASPTGTAPSDELSLCFEGTYASGATVSFTDTLTDALLGAALYTNASQETTLKANDQPPLCWDVAPYRGVMFYSNTAESFIDAQVIATGVGAIDVGSTITMSGLGTITGAAVENVGAKQFLVDTTSPSISDRWGNTAVSIVRVFNQNAAAANAYAISTDGVGLPGHIRIVSKTGTAIGLTTTAPAAAFKVTQPGSVQHPNRVYWSKPQLPDAVPVLNYADVGSSAAAVIRTVPTRDSLFVFKEDGLWRISGDAEPWDVRPFDPTCLLRSVRSAVTLDNSVFALTNQGVVRVSDTGVTVVSRPIETALRAAISWDGAETGGFAVAYESDRKYLLWAVNSPPGYTYDLFTQAWTARTDNAFAGVADTFKDDLLLISSSALTVERKAFTDADFADPGGPIACVVKWAPKFATPGLKQHFQEVGLLFRKLGGSACTLTFTSDLVPSPAGTVNVTLADYGTPPFSPFSLRTLVPLEQSRGSQLSLTFSQSVNGTTFQLQGMSLTHRVTDEEAGS